MAELQANFDAFAASQRGAITPPAPSRADVAAQHAADEAALGQARAELAALKQDKAFMQAALINGDASAKAKLDAAQAKAFPPEAAEAAEASADEHAPLTPIQFANTEMSATEVVGLNRDVHEAISAIGLEPQMAVGLVQTLDREIAGRGGRDAKPGDEMWQASIDARLKERWGADYQKNFDVFDAACKRAGKHEARIRGSIARVSVNTAILAMESLVNSQRART